MYTQNSTHSSHSWMWILEGKCRYRCRGKGEDKCTAAAVSTHAMKAYWGSRWTAPNILNLSYTKRWENKKEK